jgi:ankyrin repeat protein
MNTVNNKEITNLIINEVETFKKNIKNLLLKTDFSDFEKYKFCEQILQTELIELQQKLTDFNFFEVSLDNILNSKIILTDKALQKFSLKDLLEQINDIENLNDENLNDIPNIIYDIIDTISTNEEVKIYLNETEMTIQSVKDGIKKLFNSLINNIAVTAAPRDEDQRRIEYNKFLKGFKVMAEILKESSIEPILKLGNIIMISEISHYCASGWKETLLELMTKFSEEIKEKYKDLINLDYEKDPLKRILYEIFFDAREIITKDLSYKYIEENNIKESQRPHYINAFKEVFNEMYYLNLPFIETTDSYLGINGINRVKESFMNYLKNTNIEDLIYIKACELFYDRLKQEPDYYVGSKIKPKFWEDIMEWAKGYFARNKLNEKYSSPVEFMTENIIGKDYDSKNPIRYTAIKEIMKDCGFINEFIKDNNYGNDYYRQQPTITMTRLKRGIIDIKSEKELNQLTSDLVKLRSRGIDIESLINFLIDEEDYEKLKYINFDNLDININEVDKNEATMLMRICKISKDYDIIKNLLKSGSNINQKDKDGLTPLMYAIKYNHKNIQISKFLIENGADVNLLNNYDSSPLMLACGISENLELIKLLIQSGSNINQQNKDGWTALMIAIRHNKDISMIKLLIEQGSDINIINNYQCSSLMIACRNSNSLELIKLLIDAGSNVNQQSTDGWTALMLTIEYINNIEITRYLIENGANVNLSEKENWTPLMFACRYSNDLELIKLLIKAGSDVNHKDKDGWTPLMCAVKNNNDIDNDNEDNDNDNENNNENNDNINNTDNDYDNNNINIIKFLIENGADVNSLNKDKWNALMIACRYSKNLELVKLLIESGSNIKVQNKDKYTVLMITRKYNKNKNIFNYLVETKKEIKLSKKKNTGKHKTSRLILF